MAPRRQLLLLLSAIALVAASFAMTPRQAAAATVTFFVDTTVDNDAAGGCTNSLDNDDCSLRQAITAANNHTPAADTKVISFQYFTVGASAATVFTLDSAKPELPQITANNVEVVANTNFGIPLIEINGNGKAVGLQLAGDDGKVSGLSLYGFTNNGIEPFFGSAIYITGDRNDIVTSWIGIDSSGATPTGGQNFSGIRIDGGGTGNVIGGPGGESVANYISGNNQNGVIIRNSSGNFVQNNFIGLARQAPSTTIVSRPNTSYGIQIISVSGTSANNVIGGAEIGLANVISANGQAGILLRDTGTTSTTIQANYVGIDKLNTDFGNAGDGIQLENGTSNNLIGGVAQAPLVISGNGGYGIHLRTNGSTPNGNRINAATYVGTSTGGSTAIPNALGGILVANGVTNTRIEGTGNDLRIAGNGGPGISVLGEANSSTRVAGALIGIVPIAGAGAPSDDLPNSGGGVLIEDARSATVTTSTISGNSLFGVRVSRALTTTIQSNYIGADLARTGTLPNLGVGVELLDAGNTTVLSNTVAGHPQAGVVLRGATASSVISNSITGNTAGGLLLETVGVSTTTRSTLTSNTISGNGQFGLRLSGALTTTLRTNFVGLSTVRTATLPNGGNGVEIFDSRNTLVIDSFIAANAAAGLVVSGTNTFSTTINNSNIGMIQSAPGGGFTAPAANALQALRITGGAQNTVVSGGVFGGAGTADSSPAGILIEASPAVTITGATIGGVKETLGQTVPTLPRPFGPGISVTGPITNVQILTNTLRFNRGAGILVAGDSRRVRMIDNRLTENAAGITLAGTSRLTVAQRPPAVDPGSLTNPNHDIDPPPIDVTTFSDPLRVRVTDQGIISGYVITSTNLTEQGLSPVSACVTCTLQIFRPNEGAADGQGWTTVGTRLVGDTSSAPAITFGVDASGRFTRQLVGGVGAPGSQLLLVATDGFGNSSEYAVFPVSSGLSLTNLTGNLSAAPGDIVTYTLRLSNTGSLDATGLSLRTTGTLARWGIVTSPVTNTIFTTPTPLEAGGARLITVTLTLPRGSDANVRAGTTDVTTVTVVKEGSTLSQSVRLETTVLPRPVLVVTPTVSLGKARPTETVPHTHVVRNDGNVTVTVDLTDTTLDPVGQTGLWVTTVNTRSFTLTPGGETRVRVDVTVPQGAQVTDPQGNPVEAKTFVTATVPLSPTGGFGPVTTTFTDTTQVDLDPDAAITDGDQEQDGAAGEAVVFTHFVQNLSNAPTRFCFIWSTNLGSTVRFESRTDGFVVDANGCFSLDTQTVVGENRFQQAQFAAVVTVDRRALPGNREVVNLSLRNQTTNETIGSATVVDYINVTRGLKAPRIWMPFVRR